MVLSLSLYITANHGLSFEVFLWSIFNSRGNRLLTWQFPMGVIRLMGLPIGYFIKMYDEYSQIWIF